MQLPLALKPARTHGGRRHGAGRPKTSDLQPHVARGEFKAREPLHITVRLAPTLPSLRRKDVFRSLRDAVKKARARGLAVIHYSILSNHAHFLVETQGKRELARQMQSLGISFSKQLNRIARRKGPVFRERYHVHVLRTPRETRNALQYVLTNEYRHLGRKGRVELNVFSSAMKVADGTWQRLLGRTWRRIVAFPPWDDDEVPGDEWVGSPKTWLLREGWMRAKA